MTLFSQPQKYIFMILLSPSGILRFCAHFQHIIDVEPRVEQLAFLIAIVEYPSEVLRDKLARCNSCIVI